MHNIDVYDFDGTVYNGDSSIDFLLYAIKRKKKLIKYTPKIFIYMMLKSVGLISTKKFKEIYFSFIKEIDNIEKFIEEFWKEKEIKINKFFIENIKECENNYIISASPEFLLKPYILKFKNVKLIATKFEKNGKIIGQNCKGKEKVKLLNEAEKEFTIDNFYTDSITDLPLVKIAKNSYFVNRGKIEKWNINKVKDKTSNKCAKFIFIIFLIFYLILGVQLSYNYNLTTKL